MALSDYIIIKKIFEVLRDAEQLAYKKLERVLHKVTIVLTKKYQNRKTING